MSCLNEFYIKYYLVKKFIHYEIISHQVVRNSHFEIVEGGKSWLGTFGKHLKPHNYKRLRSGQKVNHYPGCFVLGRKDRLWRTISRFIAKFGHAGIV